MLKFRKLTVVAMLSISLSIGSVSFASPLDDTAGLPGEAAINKLVSLHVFASAEQFNPAAPLTREGLAIVLSRVMHLNAPKTLTIKDVTTKQASYDAIAKVVGSGLLKLDSKGNFNPKSGATYGDFSRALASGLGLKLTWTDRPVDFLFYLNLKGVLDLDTNLDAVVTREDAAIALDKYITLKSVYKSDRGVVSKSSAGSITINNGVKYAAYKLAKDSALFLSGQKSDVTSFGVGTPVELLLNEKGEVAFVTGNSLSLEEGTIVYSDGKVKVKDNLRSIDLNVVVLPLPNSLSTTFTFHAFSGYSQAGVTFGGGAYLNNKNDEVTLLDVYFKKVEDKPFTINKSRLTIDFSDDALANQTFTIADDAKISLKSEPDKTLTLGELSGLQSGNVLTGTLDINQDGVITAITATVEAKK